MGAKQTKCEGIYLPETPVGLKHIKYCQQTPQPLSVATDFSTTVNALDPRSPNAHRTPILLADSASKTKVKPSLTTMLRKRLVKGFHCNLLDPRSPSLQVTRTPIVFEDGAERTFNLDDTFADLLVETRAPITTTTNEETKTDEVQIDTNEMDMMMSPTEHSSNSLSFVSMASEESSTQEHTPITSFIQQPLDPRSPTVGVERTPLIFTDNDDDDNDEQLENEMLEDVLAKLSLDLSSAAEHSLLSLGAISDNGSIGFTDNQLKAPTNKHLERVRVPKKPARLRRVGINNTTPPSAQIYENCENISPISNTKSFTNEGNKRTPLSCVGNQVKLQKLQPQKNALAKLNIQFDKIKDINAFPADDKIES